MKACYVVFMIGWHLCALRLVTPLDNGALKTPPMGWLSWEIFKCSIKCDTSINQPVQCISEDLFIQIAEVMVKRGYKDAGYDRIHIDDCWMEKHRDPKTGRLQADQSRFPNGIKFLSDYMHNHGLKLGIYQNLGKKTCMGYPGTINHMEVDVETFAEWEVDYLKLDGCFTRTTFLDKAYAKYGNLLNKTGRSIGYACSWPYYQSFVSKVRMIPDWNLISKSCNVFRVYHDITSDAKLIQQVINFMGDHQQIFRRITGPGSWPDPDMLMIGNPGLNVENAQTQMAVWCILPAPLLMSNDLRIIDAKFEEILLNRHAIKVNQDRLAEPGERIFRNTTLEVWRRRLNGPSMALVVLNKQEKASLNSTMVMEQFEFEEFKKHNHFNVMNIFSKAQSTIDRTGEKNRLIDIMAEPQGVVFLRLTPVP